MPTVTEAFTRFLQSTLATHPGRDLVEHYLSKGGPARMETQVNVAAGNGEPVEGKRTTWTDGINSWWNVRIPRNANADPEWNDYTQQWVPEMHTEGLGATGWDWVGRCSCWVGFDFDSITGHAKGVGISDVELQRVLAAARALPCVETRRSTGGKGWHLYVYLDNIPTANHTEHAALARCVLGMMSSEAGFDFAAQVDCCGGIMWLWHRKVNASNQGLSLIHAAEKSLSVADLPSNWRDHIDVVAHKRSKVRLQGLPEDQHDTVETLTSARLPIPLDDQHKAVIQALMETGYSTVWVADHHLLQTHTCALDEVRISLKLAGPFQTNSNGRDRGTPNCFLFPLSKGSWKVYRFGQGIVEADTWTQDGDGWTTCYFNRKPDMATACRATGGVEDPEKKEWVFATADKAKEAAAILGQMLPLEPEFRIRPAKLKVSADGRLIVTVAKQDNDTQTQMPGWLAKKDKWIRKFDKPLGLRLDSNPDAELGYEDYDDVFRTLVSSAGESAGWVCKLQSGVWSRQPLSHVKMMLQHRGLNKNEAEYTMGGSVERAWKLVNLPFHSEYPGGRQWNLDAPQFVYQPSDLGDDGVPHHPHWDLILNHVGRDLNTPLSESAWAQQVGIKTGGQYLTTWIACMLRDPFEPLPYLFAFGSENCGKSIFHEAVSLLLTKGVVPADRALASRNDFNGELANAILCVVEERDLSKADSAHARLKEWVTGRMLSVRKMRLDSYTQPNTTHWFQAANQQEYCPVFKNDTRIIVMNVPDLLPEQEIPKPQLLIQLKHEAPDFMFTLMNMLLPAATGRLRLPVIATDNKLLAEDFSGDTELEDFLSQCYYVPGHSIEFKELYDRFADWLTPAKQMYWSKIKTSRELPAKYPTWRGSSNKLMVGNLAFSDIRSDAQPVVVQDHRRID